jgi:hypothetical protein
VTRTTRALSSAAVVVMAACVTVPDTKTLVGEIGGSGGTGGSSGSSSGNAGSSGSGGNAESGGSSGTDGTGEAGMAGSGGEPDVCAPQGEVITLPFAVEDHFASTGVVGDPASVSGMITSRACPVRPADPLGEWGECSEWTFAPMELNMAGYALASVRWQGPPENWGEQAGLPVQPFASMVRFRAWSDNPLVVRFFVGGAIGMCPDQIDATVTNEIITIGTEPMDYEIALEGVEYDTGVITAFGWTFEVYQLDTPTVFSVDNIRWQ